MNPRTIFRGLAATTLAGAMVFTVSACGGEDDKPREESSAPSKQEEEDGGSGTEQTVDEAKEIAAVDAQKGVKVIVNSAVRDSGGFVTVNGKIQNGGEEDWLAEDWAVKDPDLISPEVSVAGMTLVDKAGKKRYYLLRDTDNNCLCTIFSGSIAAGDTEKFYAQFPAPPKSTTEVDLNVPTGGTATIPLTDK